MPINRIATGMLQMTSTKPSESSRCVFQAGAAVAVIIDLSVTSSNHTRCPLLNKVAPVFSVEHRSAPPVATISA